MVYELSYLSTAKDCSEKDINDILETAQLNNAILGISGLLVFDGSRFAQILEGHSEAVLNVMSSIERDTRHFDIIRVSQGEVDQRTFAGWVMGFAEGAGLINELADSIKYCEQTPKNQNEMAPSLPNELREHALEIVRRAQ